jgi:thiamine-monophosphate kinase
LKDFFRGLADFCRTFSIHSAGGNIRDGQRFACHATAIGFSSRGKVLGRSRCEPGDTIVSIGTCGEFISAFLRAQRNGFHSLSESAQAMLLRPHPQLLQMQALNEACLLSAASDNSDGVLGAIWNIAEASGCEIEVDMMDDLVPRNIAEEAQIARANPWNLLFFWGDWQVIAAVSKNQYQQFVRESKTKAINYRTLGRAREGPPAIWGISNKGRHQLRVLRNEAFRPRSFDTDPVGHVSKMLHAPLF